MDIEIKVGIKTGGKGDVYNIDLNIPTTGMSKDKPFRFVATVKAKGKNVSDTVLEVIYGDNENYLISAAAPKSLLPGMDQYVDSLAVIVKEGKVKSEDADTQIVELTELPDAKPEELPENVDVKKLEALNTPKLQKPKASNSGKTTKK